MTCCLPLLFSCHATPVVIFFSTMPSSKADSEKIESNLQTIRHNIAEACRRAGRSPGEVSIIAVTKSADMEALKVALDLGLTHLGESRVQQLCDRAAELTEYLQRRRAGGPPPQVRWHMIGHLQRNKVRQVLGVASTIHSVDSLRLAEDISARAERDGISVDLMLEVNCSQEPQKYGCAVGAALHMAELVCTLKNIRLVGLMTMAELTQDAEKSRPVFALLRELFDELRHNHVGGDAFRHLSMGMSQDYTVAVEEGATMVRIGTALFGR
jgi:PLP dependent protein